MNEKTLENVRLVIHPSSFIIHPFLIFAGLICFAAGGCNRGRGEPDVTAPARRPVSVAADVQSPRPDSASWPLFRGDPQATGVASGTLPTKLELLWTFSTAEGGFESTVAIVDGTVYAGCTDGNLYALDLRSGAKRWQFSTPLGFSASAAVHSGRVFIGDADGVFYCIDAATGKKVWGFQTDAEIDSSANFYNGHVLFGSQDSYLYCLDATSGKLIWKFQSQDQIRCFPSVVASLGFVAGCDGQLHAIDLRGGQEVARSRSTRPPGRHRQCWAESSSSAPKATTSLPSIRDSAQILWRDNSAQHGAAFRSSAAVTPEAVLVGSRDKQLHALDPKTGQPLWTFTTKGRVDSSPVVVGDRVYFGSTDGRLYGLYVKTGKMFWHFEAGGAIVASPAVADRRLVIGNDSGNLYCLGAKKEDNGSR